MTTISDVYSPRTKFRCSRLRGARIGSTICQYCAVGCSQLGFFKGDTLIDVEGDPRSSVNQGRLCPKGSSTFALNDNPYRKVKPMYRAPGTDKWEEVSLDWILDTVAKRIWDSRKRGFVEKDGKTGITVNNCANIGFIGGSANDNEECYLFRKLFTGGLGILPVENSARYCHSTTVAALSPTFGFGACTNPPRDLMNSDCIVIMGSNMAEAHPVAFYWPMQAKKKGAVTIHVDPRYTRTSAACDHHVHIRPGTDIAFLSGIIRYILKNELWFKEYVLAFTNASIIINPKFRFDDVTGLFNGWDPEKRSYSEEVDSWDYVYETGPDGKRGEPKRDPTLQDPHCVMQLLRRQVEKYTPEMVGEICGCRACDVVKVAEFMARNSGRDKTTAFCYATGFTQHSSGTQIIRTCAILQLLLGNIGRPGGGILALRGHSNVQGATDIPTLFGDLPNYIPLPEIAPQNATLKDYLENGHGFSGARDKQDGMWKLETERGSWKALPKYMISLLKAWYGDAATADNEYGYQWLPKLGGNQSLTVTMERALKGEVEGLLVFGQNLAVTNPNAGWSRDALRSLKWLVVCDMFENETASVWYADPTGPAPKDCQTEVFYLPTSSLMEKDGSANNTERLMQWHDRIRVSPGDCRSDAWWTYQLGKRLKAMAESEGLPRDEGLRALTWMYDDAPGAVNAQGLPRIEGDCDIDAVALEMNGVDLKTGKPIQGSGELRDDGSTLCGCRLLSGFINEDGENLMKRREAGTPDHEIDLYYRYAWPLNSRVLYNRCSSDLNGKPWSERKKLVWWDEASQSWVGFDHPQFDASAAPSEQANAFGVHTDGRAWLFVPYGIKEGPFPVYYETSESPYKNLLWSTDRVPDVRIIEDKLNPMVSPGDPNYPTVMTTYHMTEHWLSGAMTRHTPWLVALQPASFIEIAPEVAESIGVTTGGYVSVKSPRTEIQVRALVTPRLRIGRINGKPASIAGRFVCSGYKGVMCDPITNDLSPADMAPDGLIPSSKGFVVKIDKPEMSKIRKAVPEPVEYPESMTKPVPDTPWAAQPEGRN